MDDTAYREFFEQPTQTYHRRYEALRAYFPQVRSEISRQFLSCGNFLADRKSLIRV